MNNIMPQGPQYTLLNEEFARFAAKVSNELSGAKIDHAIVGNAAVQAHVLNYLTNHYKLNNVADVSAQARELLRPTNSVDVSILPPRGVPSITFAGNALADIQRGIAHCTFDFDENRVFDYLAERVGAKRATYMLRTQDATSQLSLKLIHGAKDMGGFGKQFYEKSLQKAQTISLPFGKGRSLDMRVIPPIYLVAAKIERMEPQDAMDVLSLVRVARETGTDIPFGHIEKLLGAAYKENLERINELIGAKH